MSAVIANLTDIVGPSHRHVQKVLYSVMETSAQVTMTAIILPAMRKHAVLRSYMQAPATSMSATIINVPLTVNALVTTVSVDTAKLPAH